MCTSGITAPLNDYLYPVQCIYVHNPDTVVYYTTNIFDTDTSSVEMIAVPIVVAIIVLLFSGGIVAILILLFKKKKAQKSLTVNTDNVQISSASSTDNGRPTNTEEKLVKVVSV